MSPSSERPGVRGSHVLLLALLGAFGALTFAGGPPEAPTLPRSESPPPAPPPASAPAEPEAPRYRALSARRLQAALEPSATRGDLQAELYAAIYRPYAFWIRQAQGQVPDFAADVTDAGSTAQRLRLSVHDALGGDRLGPYLKGHFDAHLPLDRWMDRAARDARRGAEAVIARVAERHHRRVAATLGALRVEPPAADAPALALDARWLDHMAHVSRDTAATAGKGAVLGLVSGALFAKSVLGAGALFAPKTLGVSAVGAALFAGVVTVARNDAEEAEFRTVAYRAIAHLEARLKVAVAAQAEALAIAALDQLEADTARLLSTLDGRPIPLPYDHPLAVEFAR